MPVYVEMKKDSKTGKMVEKLVNGQKQYYIRTYVTDEFGNRKQVNKHNKEWLGRDGKKEAEWEEKTLQNKKYNKYEKITLDELFDMYLDDINTRLKTSSIKKCKDDYCLYIKPILGKKKVFELTNNDILKFHEKLNKRKKIVKNDTFRRCAGEYDLSINFKKTIHITLVSILNFGCKYIGLPSNVASVVGNFRNPKGSVKKDLSFLTENEFENFINYEQNEIYKDFFTLLFYTGMRRGELLALTIDDIDFKNNQIDINKAINPRNGINATVPKTNHSNRKIKMLKCVSNILTKYKNTDSTRIFGLEIIKPTTLQRKCDNNCKNANIEKNIRIHDFRHSFASMCIEKQVPIEVISEYLGHENISTTLNIYAHLYPNSQDKLVSVLDKQD